MPESRHGKPLGPAAKARQRFLAHRPAVLGAAFLLALALALLLLPFVIRIDPNTPSDATFAGPSALHPFGTDIHGRDLLARCVVGARVSLVAGLVGACLSVVLGTVYGLMSGYLGGRADVLMMRAVDLLYALPNIIFVMLVLGTAEAALARLLQGAFPALADSARMLVLFACLGAISWLNMARIVRGQVLSLRTRPFVLASRIAGASPFFILRRHLLPNVLGVVLAYAAVTVPAVILYESFLSFLGMGIRPPDASLGTLIEDGARQLNPIHVRWWLLALPGGLLAMAILALHAVADGLRDAFDPQASG